MNISKLVKTLLKFFLSLCVGIVLLVYFMKNDPRIKQEISKRLNPLFSFLLSSHVAYRLESIDLFPARIVLHDVKTRSQKEGDWNWDAKKIVMSCSWFDFLLYGTISLDLVLHDFEVYSKLNEHGLSVWKHIESMYEGTAYIPTFLQSLKIKNARLIAQSKHADTSMKAEFCLNAKTLANAFKGAVSFSDGNLRAKDAYLFENLKGSVRFDVLGQTGSPKLFLSSNCTVCIPQMGEKQVCHVGGSWRYDQGLFSLKNDDRSFVIGPVKLYTVGGVLSVESIAHFPASYLQHFFSKTPESFLSGNCLLKTNIDIESPSFSVRGKLVAEDLLYGAQNVAHTGTVLFRRTKKVWNGVLFIALSDAVQFAGSFQWDEKKSAGQLHVNNKTSLVPPSFGSWTILPTQLNAQVNIKEDGSAYATFRSVAKNKKIDSEFICSGTGTFSDKTFTVEGMAGKNSFCFSCATGAQPCMKKCVYRAKDGTALVDIKAHKTFPDRFIGTVAFPFVQKFLSETYGYDLQGQGIVKLYGMVKNKKLYTQLDFIDGNIRLPHTYNFLHRVRARFVCDPIVRSVMVRDLLCLFHRGKLLCPRAVLHFDENYVPNFVHAPVLFEDCLLSWKKDLFAVVSGYVTCKKEQGLPALVKGRFCIDRSQLKQNIFSSEFQRSFFSAPATLFDKQGEGVLFDLKVKTKEPVRIKTSFLQTSAHINALFAGTVHKPKLSGHISLTSGSLEFPYRPLHITKGLIEFVPGQLYDPRIEISAKNKLKKYNVNLHVSGSLQEQQIVLESSPALSEEQIISLLLAGSQQESLNIVMPALIMQNVKNIMFGSDHSETKVGAAFSRLFKPLERVHLVPSFTDQTGRGGLRGAIEIDVSERWRAMIQKNFSLTEDTRFEAEYLLSDDISLRAIRDEHADVSAEVELRWKF